MNDCKTPPGGNCLLSRLSSDTMRELEAECIKTSSGDMLQSSEAPITDVYFPTTAVISVIGHMSGGEMAELGVIGNECAAGIIALMGADSSKYEKRVQVSGEVIKI